MKDFDLYFISGGNSYRVVHVRFNTIEQAKRYALTICRPFEMVAGVFMKGE